MVDQAFRLPHRHASEKLHELVRDSRRVWTVVAGDVSRLPVSLRDGRVWHVLADASDRCTGGRAALAFELGTESHGHASRRHLSETFVPRSRSWRTKTLTTGLEWVHHAADVLWKAGKREAVQPSGLEKSATRSTLPSRILHCARCRKTEQPSNRCSQRYALACAMLASSRFTLLTMRLNF